MFYTVLRRMQEAGLEQQPGFVLCAGYRCGENRGFRMDTLRAKC